MKKIMIIMLTVLFFVTAFSNLVEEARVVSEEMGKDVTFNETFWQERSQYFDSYEEFVEKMTAYKFLPDAFWDRVFGINQRMTTTDDFLVTSMKLINPESQTESSFYRIEPVRDQMRHGSCWAFANVGSFESAKAVQVLGKRQDGGNTENIYDYSERWVAYHNIDWDIYGANMDTDAWIIQDRNSLEGGNGVFASYNSIRYGHMNEENAPYSEIGITVQEQIPLPAQAYGAERYHSSKTVVIPTANYAWALGFTYDEYINMIKTAIKNYGSLAVSYSPDGAFGAYTKGIYTAQTPTSGGHAVTMVGWAAVEDLDEIIVDVKNPEGTPVLTSEQATDTWIYFDGSFELPVERSTQLCWIVKNSWGYSWGDGGYYVIAAISEEDYNLGLIGDWQHESREMFVPIFDSVDKHEGDDLDINADGTINQADFNALTDMLGQTDVVIGDLAYPKDGKITNDDIAAWIYLFNQ